jgi:Tfp pilus assembly ATPase PilU
MNEASVSHTIDYKDPAELLHGTHTCVLRINGDVYLKQR